MNIYHIIGLYILFCIIYLSMQKNLPAVLMQCLALTLCSLCWCTVIIPTQQIEHPDYSYHPELPLWFLLMSYYTLFFWQLHCHANPQKLIKAPLQCIWLFCQDILHISESLTDNVDELHCLPNSFLSYNFVLKLKKWKLLLKCDNKACKSHLKALLSMLIS